MKRAAFLILSTLVVAGCATGNNYNADLEAMNAKIASLQNQLEGKNREIASLQDQVRSLTAQLSLANQQKADWERKAMATEQKLMQALTKLAATSGTSGTSSNISTKTISSDSGIK